MIRFAKRKAYRELNGRGSYQRQHQRDYDDAGARVRHPSYGRVGKANRDPLHITFDKILLVSLSD